VNELTIAGNLTADPELRTTSTGAAVCRFRIANTPRIKADDGTWRDGEPTFLDCQAWRALAENIAESLRRGDRVLVAGRIRTERWDSDGQTRTRVVLEVESAGADLAYATARPVKASRRAGGQQAMSTPDGAR